MSRLAPLICCLLFLIAGISSHGAIFLRWNQAGYAPAQPKVVLVLSDADLGGKDWSVWREANLVLKGKFDSSVTGTGDHTPFAFNHVLDLSEIQDEGEYQVIVAGAAPAKLTIAANPYTRLLQLPLRHLRLMRSGSYHTLLREFSHPGDARAAVMVPAGDPAEGKWEGATPARTVDAVGGWYDAGDQIKFTLTIATTTHRLLLAYQLNPAFTTKWRSHTELPDLLDEAKHGLDFLLRVHPDRDTFVIQVGNAEDHRQPPRLPEEDKLDGHRPALCALSQVHMGATAAALALGARIFGELGQSEDAARYAAKSREIYARAREADVIPTAYERDEGFEFYRDKDPRDQLTVAAMELFALTKETEYLEQAKAYAPPAGAEISWASWNWLANLLLAPHDSAAGQRLKEELTRYSDYAAKSGAPWGIPGSYKWGTLAHWLGMASALRLGQDGDAARVVFWSTTDYLFGRNNWGVSFLFDEQLPNSLRHLYSPTYKLLKRFPSGALSEGPAPRQLHDRLDRYFKIPADDPFHRFGTPAAVFFDNDTDFVCQEATISGQADALIFLALAAR